MHKYVGIYLISVLVLTSHVKRLFVYHLEKSLRYAMYLLSLIKFVGVPAYHYFNYVCSSANCRVHSSGCYGTYMTVMHSFNKNKNIT